MCLCRVQRANEGGFPIGLQERCWALVADRLRAYEYVGPVGLSCDDTKLFAAFRPYHDRSQNMYYLLGSTGQPLEIRDPEDFARVVRQGDLQKATKVCPCTRHLSVCF